MLTSNFKNVLRAMLQASVRWIETTAAFSRPYSNPLLRDLLLRFWILYRNCRQGCYGALDVNAQWDRMQINCRIYISTLKFKGKEAEDDNGRDGKLLPGATAERGT